MDRLSRCRRRLLDHQMCVVGSMAGDSLTAPELQQYIERWSRNIARTHNLVSVYKFLAGTSPGRRSVGDTDVLRSAVVLLHASLEDFLRAIARSCLPRARPEVISTIPLKGTTASSRAEKFSLGQLDEHRGKTVDEVIAESVEAYLEHSNFSNTTQIASLLESLDLDVEPMRAFFPMLDNMIARRHQIVHRADCAAETGKGRHHARSLRVSDVERWITAALNFHSAVLSQL